MSDMTTEQLLDATKESNAALRKENTRLKAAVTKMSHRRCFPCGHVAYYLSDLVVHCRCEMCGSADTREIRKVER